MTTSELLSKIDTTQLAQGGLRVLVVLVLWWLLSRFVEMMLRRMGARLIAQAESSEENPVEARKRVETLVRLLTQVVRIVLFVTLALVMLMQLGVEVGPLLASAGIIGLAVGFGAQSLVKDVITGFFMVMENQLRVGDVVKINGTGGQVESMTLRTVVLRDIAGTVHVFPNSNVSSLSNLTRGWSAYVFNIGVDYRVDPDVAIATLQEICAELHRDPVFGALILEPAQIYGVDQLSDSAVIIRGRIKTRPMEQWTVGRELLRRVKKTFSERGIGIPFPQRTLHLIGDTGSAAKLATLADQGAEVKVAAQVREDTGEN